MTPLTVGESFCLLFSLGMPLDMGILNIWSLSSISKHLEKLSMMLGSCGLTISSMTHEHSSVASLRSSYWSTAPNLSFGYNSTLILLSERLYLCLVWLLVHLYSLFKQPRIVPFILYIIFHLTSEGKTACVCKKKGSKAARHKRSSKNDARTFFARFYCYIVSEMSTSWNISPCSRDIQLGFISVW